MNEITLRHHFDAAGASHAYRVAGPALLVQTDGPAALIQGSNFPDLSASWQDLGTCTGFTPLSITTSFAFVRVVSDGAGSVAISGASAPAAAAGGGGGGGGGDASAANQVTQIARLETLVTQTDGVETSLAAIQGIETQTRDLVQTVASRVGATDDAAAASDGASASIISLIKRALGNWTTLLARVPTLGRTTSAGSIPVTLPTDVPTDLVADSAGTLFSPASCSHVYGYDGSDNMTTDTATDGAVVRVKTITYTSGKMTAETKWVVQ